jgi:hypothetical protein
MLRNEQNSAWAVFLCLSLRNRVWSVWARLGSFRKIRLFADVLFHKKDQKRDWDLGGRESAIPGLPQKLGTGSGSCGPFWYFYEKYIGKTTY